MKMRMMKKLSVSWINNNSFCIIDDTMTSTFLAHARKIRSFAVLAPAAAAWIQSRMAFSLRKWSNGSEWWILMDFIQFHCCFHGGNAVRKTRGWHPTSAEVTSGRNASWFPWPSDELHQVPSPFGSHTANLPEEVGVRRWVWKLHILQVVEMAASKPRSRDMALKRWSARGSTWGPTTWEVIFLNANWGLVLGRGYVLGSHFET